MRRRGVAAALAVMVLSPGALTAGCGLDQRTGSGSDVETRPRAGVEVRAWGVLDTLVSVVVVNTTDRTLRYAQGQVRALGADGDLVAASPGGRGACCTIVDLAPGEQYGLYLDAGEGAADVRDVDVDVRNLSWTPAGGAVADRVTGTARDLTPTRRGAVVTADLTVPAGPATSLVQAFVVDADGEFLGVVSGRWSCLPTGRTPIRMQLFHPVPAGARVDRLVAHAAAGDPDAPTDSCR